MEFIRHIQEYWHEKDALEPDRDIFSYLVTRLKCEHKDVEKMIKVFPNLKRATIKRIKPNLDYLLIGNNVFLLFVRLQIKTFDCF